VDWVLWFNLDFKTFASSNKIDYPFFFHCLAVLGLPTLAFAFWVKARQKVEDRGDIYFLRLASFERVLLNASQLLVIPTILHIYYAVDCTATDVLRIDPTCTSFKYHLLLNSQHLKFNQLNARRFHISCLLELLFQLRGSFWCLFRSLC
jgi:hypothetical protein